MIEHRHSAIGGARRLPIAALAPWHVVAGAFLLGAVLAQVFRPLAPDLGPIPDPDRWFTPDHLSTVARYRAPRYLAFVLGLGLRLAVPLLAAFSGPGRRLVERIIARVGPSRPARAAAAVVLVIVVATEVMVLPLSFWIGFVHEGAYGFRTQGLAGWTVDWLLAVGPAWLVTGLLALGGYALMRRLPRYWPVAAAGAGVALTVAGVFAAPVLIEPLRYDTRPLTDAAVRVEVERVMGAAGLEVDTILIADASRRTTKQNAYVSGLGATRRIVLYDNLLNRPVDEIGLVLAHELAHDRNGDLWRGTLLGSAGVLVAVYAIAWVVARRVRAGVQGRPENPSSAAAVVAVLSVMSVLALPLESAVSRRAEAAADLGALELTGDPDTYVRMNKGLAIANLTDPAPPTWYRLLRLTHPPAASRLEMGERWPFG